MAFALVFRRRVPVQCQEAEDGQWPMPAKNHAGTRFSGLAEIENAKNLRVAWKFSLGVNRGQEAPPIVVGDTMYVVTIVKTLKVGYEPEGRGGGA